MRKYTSKYPSRLRRAVKRRKLKDPYSAAHLQWVKGASDFRHRDAKTQMTASIVASRMAEEHDPDLKWKRVSDRYSGTEYHSHDGNFRIKQTGYHPTMGYAHRIRNKSWWTVHKKDEKLGVAPDYMVMHRSHRSLADAKKSVSEWSHRMKTFKEAVENTEEQHLYHVTHTHHVPSIQKHGLNPMGGPSNWVKAGTGERYGKGEIYTFTHHEDAKRWAMNMDWAHHQTLGSGKISIIKMKHPKDHPFEEDKNDPLEVMTRKGPALKSYKRIDQKHIVHVQKFDQSALKEDLEIDDDLIEAINEWTAEWVPTWESTESALNSQWIQKQNVRKNPKLKEDKEEDDEEDEEETSDKIGKKKTASLDDIAKKHGVDEDKLEKQLEKGIKVEMEHTKSKKEAAEIARDHLDEFPDYYDRLEKMEKKAKKDMKEWEEIPISHPEDSRMIGVNEMMTVGGGNIAGMPDADPPDLAPVGLGKKWQSKRKKKFAGRTVFTVDPGTYWKAYLGKQKYEHYEKYLEGCDIAEEIRAYGRKYWDEPIILQNEQTGAMVYLKYGSK